MNLVVPVEVKVPDGATHYSGDLLDEPTFYKMTMVGVVGEHWWMWIDDRAEWVLASHHRPSWIKELPTS
jgi:hypothetical protein